MKKRTSLIPLLALFLSFCITGNVYAQKRSKPFSPEIHQDNSVTFRLKNKHAEEVVLKGSFIPKSFPVRTPAGVFGKAGQWKMTKQDGVWTYTTKPLESEIYTYYFEVDGVRQTDPANPDTLRDIDNYYSRFVIPGGIADNYVVQDVPHGKVEKVWYASSIQGLPQRRMTIYTPSDYNGDNALPVLYLLHGSGGDETAWIRAGKAVEILDNLIAQGKCEPMIVVMPNGIANRAAAPGEDPYSDEKASPTSIESMLGKIERAFVPDIVTYVDTHYNTLKDKHHRAIAGLSLGGLHTLFISANNPDMFDYVGLFSAQTTNTLSNKKIETAEQLAQSIEGMTSLIPFLGKGKIGERLTEWASGVKEGDLAIYDSLDEKLKNQFKTPPALYYIALGKDDFVKKINDDFRLRLSDAGYQYTYHETDGGHTWENWRKYLVDFLPRIFKE